MNKDDALFELSLVNAENASNSFEDFYVWGTGKGIPPEILTRLKAIWDFTKKVAGEVVSVGKIIVTTIANFLKGNPNLTIGLALGAAVAVLSGSIPVLGPLLMPVSGALATIYGAGVGAAIDDGEKMRDATDPIVAAIALARSFMKLLIEIFQAISVYWSGDEALKA